MKTLSLTDEQASDLDLFLGDVIDHYENQHNAYAAAEDEDAKARYYARLLLDAQALRAATLE